MIPKSLRAAAIIDTTLKCSANGCSRIASNMVASFLDETPIGGVACDEHVDEVAEYITGVAVYEFEKKAYKKN